MKTTKCPLCGKNFSIDDGTVFEQHVLCPYCGGKFSYLADSPEFSLERLSYALAECRRNEADDRYYTDAPAGARLYIGLIFYGRVFRERMDHDLYLAEMAEIEPELKAEDWRYLLANEDDPDLAAYFQSKLPEEKFQRKPTKKIVREPYASPAQGVLRSPVPKSPEEEKKVPHILHLSEKENKKEVHEDLYAQRKMKITEDKARFYEELKTHEARRRTLRNIVSAVVLFGLVVTGVFAYVYLDQHRVKVRKAELELASQSAAERAKQDELKRQQRQKEEEEARLAREKKAVEEKERTERERLEREMQEKKTRQEREMAERKIRESKEFYRQILSSYESEKFGFLTKEAANGLPDDADGVYGYLLPFNDAAEPPVLTVCTVSNGIVSAYRLAQDGEKTPEEGSKFLSRLAERDYLVAGGNRVWFHSKRKKTHVGSLPKDRVVDLTDEFFGDLSREVKELGLDFDELEFEIVFIPKERKRGKQQVIVTQVIGYGASYSLERVRDAVEEYQSKAAADGRSFNGTISVRPQRRFKRTVQFWDGEQIKQGIDGITYVPRTPPNSAYYSPGPGIIIRGCGNRTRNWWRNESKRESRAAHNLDRWRALSRQAQQEDREEAAYYENQRRIRNENEERQQNAQKLSFDRRISEILSQGSLFWRARLKSNQPTSQLD